jgi:hypothetical protein
MNAGNIIYDKLIANAAVAAIVAARIYPIDAPLDVDLPCCYYDVQLGPVGDGSAPLSTAQLQVGCLAHSEATAHSLANAVHAALDGLSATDTGTWLRGLRQLGRTENRDAENNLWGVLLVYGASVTF